MELKLHKKKTMPDTRRQYLHFIDYRFYSFFWSEFYFPYKLFISYTVSYIRLGPPAMAGPLKVIDLTFVLGVLLKAAITLPIVGFTATVRQRLLQYCFW